jgi:hypothetical protein
VPLQPQQQNVKKIVDGLIAIESDKKLSNFHRHFAGDFCQNLLQTPFVKPVGLPMFFASPCGNIWPKQHSN